MIEELKDCFLKGYKEDYYYCCMIVDLTSKEPSAREVLNASKVRHPFKLKDSLLYNVNAEASTHLCILHALVLEFLASMYNKKHYFSQKYIAKDLTTLHFYNKTRLIYQ